MLESLRISEYAIIDELEIEFDPGLTILSGETGAGKSILIGALGLVLGEKADAGVIRAGADESVVTAVLVVEGVSAALDWLEAHQIRDEDGRVIIRRIVKASGRGSIYMQSSQVTRADVQAFTSLLFDIHGQHEHQSLLRKATHRELIDRFGEIEHDADAFKALFFEVQSKRLELEALSNTELERAREQDMLAFAVREIDEAQLVEGEDTELEQEIAVLGQAEKLFTAMNTLHDLIAENRGGALSALRQTMQTLREIGLIASELAPQSARLENAFYEIEDVAEIVRNYRERVDFTPGRLESCETRLAEIHRLIKKYGHGLPEVLAHRNQARKSLDRIVNLDEERGRLTELVDSLEKRLRFEAKQLSERRLSASKLLEHEVTSHLQKLGMAKARFEIHLDRRERSDGRPIYTQYGIDSPEFLISPNDGEPLKPLRDIASGGEISRIMLALKSVLSASDEIRTLVFDEIDAGIGGNVAVSVGEHLAELAESKQVLCITHLPTIAVRANRHLRIGKTLRDERTVTVVHEVSGEERVAEVARMLAGDSNAPVSREHARKLLAEAMGQDLSL